MANTERNVEIEFSITHSFIKYRDWKNLMIGGLFSL